MKLQLTKPESCEIMDLRKVAVPLIRRCMINGAKVQEGNVKKTMLGVFAAALFVQACSTPPANPGEVFDARNRSGSQMDLGNRHSARGDPQTALFLLDDALRLATLADDSALIVMAGLSRSDVLFSLGRSEEASAAIDTAAAEARRAENKELAALCTVSSVRQQLPSYNSGEAASAAVLVRGMIPLFSSRLNTAFARTTVALAEAAAGNFSRAEDEAALALAIHERLRSFELAAYDWFMIASFRSRAGDLPGARQALESSMEMDRRVENSWGLASSWRAMGDVERKAGNWEASRAAYLRAAGIFRAMGSETVADEALSLADW